MNKTRRRNGHASTKQSPSRLKALGAIYIIDSNVLIYDHLVAQRLGRSGDTIVVPLAVVEELDHLKYSQNPVGIKAQRAIAQIDAYNHLGALQDGIVVPTGARLLVDITGTQLKRIPCQFVNSRTIDKAIIELGLSWKKKNPLHDVVLITKDMAVRVVAQAHNLATRDYTNEAPRSATAEKFTGVRRCILPVSDDQLVALLSTFSQKKRLDIGEMQSYVPTNELVPNIGCELSNGNGKAAWSIYKTVNDYGEACNPFLRWVPKPRQNGQTETGILPLDIRQAMAYNLLLDDSVTILTIGGKAGTGKTLLSLTAAINQLRQKKYQRLLVFRPNVCMGEEFGFLPGDIERKMLPLKEAIFDNLEYMEMMQGGSASKRIDRIRDMPSKSIVQSQHYEQCVNAITEGQLSFPSIAHVRGRTFHNAMVIIDDAQNLSRHQIKTLASRLGMGSRLIITGDVEQIDTQNLTRYNNGFTYAQQRLHGEPLCGHIQLDICHRGPGAILATRCL